MTDSDEYDDTVGNFSKEDYVRKLRRKYTNECYKYKRSTGGCGSGSGGYSSLLDKQPQQYGKNSYYNRYKNASKKFPAHAAPPPPYVTDRMPYGPPGDSDMPYYFLPVICLPQTMVASQMHPPFQQHGYARTKMSSDYYATTKSKSMVNLTPSFFEEPYSYDPNDLDDDLDLPYSMCNQFLGNQTGRPKSCGHPPDGCASKTFLNYIADDTNHYFYNQDFASKSTVGTKDDKATYLFRNIPLMRKRSVSSVSLRNVMSRMPRNCADFCCQTDFPKSFIATQTPSSTSDKSSKNEQTMLKDITKLLLLMPNDNWNNTQPLRNLKDYLDDKSKNETQLKKPASVNEEKSHAKSFSRSPSPEPPKSRIPSPGGTRKLRKGLNLCTNKDVLFPKLNKKH